MPRCCDASDVHVLLLRSCRSPFGAPELRGNVGFLVKNVGGANHSEKKSWRKNRWGGQGNRCSVTVLLSVQKNGQRKVADNMFQRVGLHRPISR